MLMDKERNYENINRISHKTLSNKWTELLKAQLTQITKDMQHFLTFGFPDLEISSEILCLF